MTFDEYVKGYAYGGKGYSPSVQSISSGAMCIKGPRVAAATIIQKILGSASSKENGLASEQVAMKTMAKATMTPRG